MGYRLKLTHKQNCLILLLLGMGIFAFEGYSAVRGFQAAAWPTASGQVTKSQMRRTGSGRRRNAKATIEYKYFVHGESYRNDRIQYGRLGMSVGTGLSFTQKGVLRNYSKGSLVTVHFNPDDPSQSVLETGLPISAYVLTAIAAAISVYAVSVLFAEKSSEEMLGATY